MAGPTRSEYCSGCRHMVVPDDVCSACGECREWPCECCNCPLRATALERMRADLTKFKGQAYTLPWPKE